MAKKIIISLIIIYCIFTGLIIAGTLYHPDKKDDKLAHILIQQEPEDLSPIFGSMSAASEIERLIFTPMVQIHPDGSPEPLLVEEIPTVENGGVKQLENGKVITTWTFKKSLQWEDGHPLGPKDVIFTWKVIMHKDVQVTERDMEKRIESMSIDPMNPLKLIITWKKPYAFHFRGFKLLPKHILESSFNNNPGKLHLHPYNKKPLGNGPFKIVEWKNGTYIYLERNNNFFGERAKLDRIWYQFISDNNTMILSLLSKNGDAISPVGLSLDQVLDFEEQYGTKFNAHFKEGIVWEHIDFNLDDPILKDLKVRQAIIYAINRKDIVKYLYKNQLEVAHSWLPPLHPGYYKEIKKYPYNLKKAAKLLDKAGWKVKAGEKYRKNSKGKELKLTLLTTAGNKVRESVQVAIKENLKKVGINLDVSSNQDAVALFGHTIPRRKFQMAMYAWIFSPIADGENLWTIENIPSEKNNFLGDNAAGYRNKTVNRIHKTIPQTLDPEKRKKLFHKQQKIWIKDLPCLPLYFRKEVSITAPYFKNWKPTGTDLPISWNNHLWDIDFSLKYKN